MLNVKPDSSSSRSPAAVAAVSDFISEVFDSLGFQFKTEEVSFKKNLQNLLFS